MAVEKKRLGIPTPVLIWGGVAVVVLFFGKQLLDAVSRFFWGKQPGFEGQEILPLAPGSAGVIAGEILSPQNGGLAQSEGIEPETYMVKASVTNPDGVDREVQLSIVTKEFPHLRAETGATLTKALTLKPGRNVFDLRVQYASTLRVPGTTTPAYAQLFVDGRTISSAVFYEIQ